MLASLSCSASTECTMHSVLQDRAQEGNGESRAFPDSPSRAACVPPSMRAAAQAAQQQHCRGSDVRYVSTVQAEVEEFGSTLAINRAHPSRRRLCLLRSYTLTGWSEGRGSTALCWRDRCVDEKTVRWSRSELRTGRSHHQPSKRPCYSSRPEGS